MHNDKRARVNCRLCLRIATNNQRRIQKLKRYQADVAILDKFYRRPGKLISVMVIFSLSLFFRFFSKCLQAQVPLPKYASANNRHSQRCRGLKKVGPGGAESCNLPTEENFYRFTQKFVLARKFSPKRPKMQISSPTVLYSLEENFSTRTKFFGRLKFRGNPPLPATTSLNMAHCSTVSSLCRR